MMPRPLLFRYVLKQFSVRIKTGDAVSCVFARFGGYFVIGTEVGECRDVHTVLYTDA